MSGIIKTILVAVSRNGIIGRDGDMPWRLSTDLKRFKALTLGRPMVMGRKTFEAIGRPLPGRETFVVSRDPAFAPEGVTVLAALDAALEVAEASAAAKGVSSFVVAGGGVLYAATLHRADRLYITRVAASPEGDTHFPPIDPALWALDAAEPMVRGERDSADAVFETWVRRR